MKKHRISVLISLIFIMFLLFSSFAIAEITEEPYYIQILKGKIDSTAAFIIPSEVLIAKAGTSGIPSGTTNPLNFKMIYKTEQLTAYITEKGADTELPLSTEPLAIRNDVFNQMLTGKEDKEIKAFLNIYKQIEDNLKNQKLLFSAFSKIGGEGAKPEIYLNFTFSSETEWEYSLLLNDMTFSGITEFNSFSLKSSEENLEESIYTISEINKNNAKKQINVTQDLFITPENKLVDSTFSLKSIKIISDSQTKIIDLPFKMLKTGQFEIKNNILYSAVLNSEQIPPTTDTYYYLPQGFVVFPDDSGEINTKFYRKGTKYYTSKQEFLDYDFILRNTKAWVSATCSCNCKTLFKGVFTLKTTPTKIIEINLAKDAEFFYSTGSGLLTEFDYINSIKSLKDSTAFSSSSISPTRTQFVFDENWNLKFPGRQVGGAIVDVDESETLNFEYNKIEIEASPKIAATSTGTTITLMPKKLDISRDFLGSSGTSQIYYKAATKEKPPRELLNPGNKLTFITGATGTEKQENLLKIIDNRYNDFEKIRKLIKTAKQFEKDFEQVEIEIPESPNLFPPIALKDDLTIKPQPKAANLCSASYSDKRCIDFKEDILAKDIVTTTYFIGWEPDKDFQQILKFNFPFSDLGKQRLYSCVLSKTCGTKENPQWCCPGGSNIRCCSGPPIITTSEELEPKSLDLPELEYNPPVDVLDMHDVEYPEKISVPIVKKPEIASEKKLEISKEFPLEEEKQENEEEPAIKENPKLSYYDSVSITITKLDKQSILTYGAIYCYPLDIEIRKNSLGSYSLYYRNELVGMIYFDSTNKFFKIDFHEKSIISYRKSAPEIAIMEKIKVMISKEEFEKIAFQNPGGQKLDVEFDK